MPLFPIYFVGKSKSSVYMLYSIYRRQLCNLKAHNIHYYSLKKQSDGFCWNLNPFFLDTSLPPALHFIPSPLDLLPIKANKSSKSRKVQLSDATLKNELQKLTKQKEGEKEEKIHKNPKKVSTLV